MSRSGLVQAVDQVIQAILSYPVERSFLKTLDKVQRQHQHGGLQQGQQGGEKGHAQALGKLFQQRGVLVVLYAAGVAERQRDADYGADETQRRDQPDDVTYRVVPQFDLVLEQFQAGVEHVVGLLDSAADLELEDATGQQALQEVGILSRQAGHAAGRGDLARRRLHRLLYALVEAAQVLLAQQGGAVLRQQPDVHLLYFPVGLEVAQQQLAAPDEEHQPHDVLYGERVRHELGIPVQQEIREKTLGQQQAQHTDEDHA